MNQNQFIVELTKLSNRNDTTIIQYLNENELNWANFLETVTYHKIGNVLYSNILRMNIKSFFPDYIMLILKNFYKNALNPTAVALATQSSLATLPTNLESASNMGISKDIREVSMSVGSTMNMHGSVMASILKISFLFSVFGRSFTGLDTYLIAILISVLSGVVMSGIPSGGLIGEMLIVSMYSFPAGAFLIISTIGIIVDAPATALNVMGNPTSAMLVSRLVEGKNWLKKKLTV